MISTSPISKNILKSKEKKKRINLLMREKKKQLKRLFKMLDLELVFTIIKLKRFLTLLSNHQVYLEDVVNIPMLDVSRVE